MAKADAWGAPGESVLSKRKAHDASLAGNARIIAAPAYRRLLAAEPILRRSIPTLIVIFLLVVAAARAMSLMAWRDDVERNAKAVLGLAAGEIVNSLMLTKADGGQLPQMYRDLLERTGEHGLMGARYALAVTDRDFKVLAATPESAGLEGKSLETMATGGQPLFIFGERAGVMEVKIDGRDWLAAVSLTRSHDGAAVAMASKDAVFAAWRKTVSLNISLFVLTSAVLIIILYAYFGQAARAEAADRIFMETHERIDLALARGRCGLWDWDMVRGKMYWSRTMYDMLGYERCDGMLSFGDVAEIVHADDGDLFKLANRIVTREVDHIDQIFRMRHANGHWIWVRARAQVVDPDAEEIQLIGIAVDVTEQHNLVQRSEVADLRLRTAIENITESFVLWDSSSRLVMCNTKYQQDSGLPERSVVPGVSREALETRMVAPVSDRRLANAHGPHGATYERQLADGRWLQVNELKTRDG